MLLDPVVSALSNFWVIKPKLTADLLYKKWILQHHEENDDLSFAAVSSCKYMYQNSPESVTPFLTKVVKLSDKNPMFTSCSSLTKEIAPNITADVISKDVRGSRYKRKGREMKNGKRKRQH